MRVYGTSPFHNYVELIFRSKRLFIVSILLATAAMAGFYFSRSKTYNARMIVLLTGTEVLNSKDDSARGTVEYKISVLNILVRDPNFIKQAMREGHLNDNKTELEFAEFCKQVTASLTYVTDRSNILEIKCSWPNEDCAKILKSFYSAYSRGVFDQETIVSTTRTRMLTTLLDAYSKKHHELDLKVRDYQLKTLARRPMDDFVTTNHEFLARQLETARIRENLQSAERQRASIADKLKNTDKNIQDSITYKGPADMPVNLTAVQARDEAQKALNDLKVKYLDKDPRVIAAQEKLNVAEALVDANKKRVNQSTQPPSKSDVSSIKVNINPQYQNLQSQLDEQDLKITSIKSDLQTADNLLKEADQRLNIAPDQKLKFEAMTADMGLYTKMRDDLRAELETARLDEMRDKELKTKEMNPLVQPEAELEKGGARGVLLLGAGPILGLIIAFCFSLLAETQDHSLRSPAEVEKYFNKPVLAVLPRMDTKKGRGQLGSGDNRPSLPS